MVQGTEAAKYKVGNKQTGFINDFLQEMLSRFTRQEHAYVITESLLYLESQRRSQ